MSRNQRLAVLAVAVAVAVVAFVIARPGDDEEDTAATVQTTTPERAGQPTATRPTARPRPSVERVRVEGGRPVGGVRRIEVDRGDTVRLQVSSSDIPEEVHVHGYDLTRSLSPGRPARFRFEADIEGAFEIELEGSHVQIASLTVEPR